MQIKIIWGEIEHDSPYGNSLSHIDSEEFNSLKEVLKALTRRFEKDKLIIENYFKKNINNSENDEVWLNGIKNFLEIAKQRKYFLNYEILK